MSDAGAPEEQQTPSTSVTVPDMYADGGRVLVSPFTVTLLLTSERRPVGILKLNPSYAKVLTVLLRKFLKEAEGKWGEPIAVPEAVLKDLGITMDDW